MAPILPLAGCGKSRIRSGFPSESWVQDRGDGAEWAVGRFSEVLGVGFNGIAHQPPVTSCGCRQQVAHPDQVVGGQCKAKHPADPRRSAMARLAQPGDRFEPAEDLLDAFTLLLTYQIAGMTSSPLIGRDLQVSRNSGRCSCLKEWRLSHPERLPPYA